MLVTLRTLDAVPLLGVAVVRARLGRPPAPQPPRRLPHRRDEAEIDGYGPVPHQVDGDYLGDVEHLVLRHEPDVLRLVIPR